MKYMIQPGKKWALKDFNPGEKGKLSKVRLLEETSQMVKGISEYQYRLYAEGRQSLLVVFQALDAGGKDGTIRKVFGPVNPQGCRVYSFKKPTELESSHDFLWRIHQASPRTGMISVFNRSHYESVLIESVHDWISEKEEKRRLAHIRNFEELLSDRGTRVLKFFLYIHKDEQKKRFQERLDIPEKNWKFSSGDLAEREHFDDYLEQFHKVIGQTSTKRCPWYVIPAGYKKYRTWLVSKIVLEHLKDMDPQYPPPEEGLDKIVIH